LKEERMKGKRNKKHTTRNFNPKSSQEKERERKGKEKHPFEMWGEKSCVFPKYPRKDIRLVCSQL